MQRRLAVLLAIIAVNPGIAAAAPPKVPGLFGVWQNPSGTVRIRTARCGASVCGTVVYASAKARADAARGGTPKLIGLNLFQQFAAAGPNIWEGKVLVPDLDRTVSGRITLVDARTMTVEGCMFGHIACKDQVWKKLA